MKRIHWKQTAAAVTLVSSLLMTPISVWADEAASVAYEAPAYALTDMTQTQVNSVLLQKTANGWMIASVVKLSNNSGTAVRIPDFELRAIAADGTSYTLMPSGGNAKSIAPQSYTELSYLAEIDSTADISLTNLQWVDVNLNVYPKVETVLADAPIADIVWRGSDSVIPDERLLDWGTGFQIPGKSSGLQYTPTHMTKQFDGQSPTYVVQIKVDNTSAYTETVPDFTVNGQSAGQSYTGKRVESAPSAVNPGDSTYVHFAITADPDATISSFTVMMPESFLKAGQTAPVQYFTGRIGFRLPAATDPSSLPAYTLGSPIAMDANSQAVNSQVTVSLMNIDWFENEGQSFKTAVAKVKFLNNGANSLPVPALGAELGQTNGNSYTGSESTSSSQELLSGIGVVRTYTFAVPNAEETNDFTLRLLEKQGQQVTAPLAQIPVSVAAGSLNTVDLAFYPFNVKLTSWALSNVATAAAGGNYNYTYKLNMDMQIETTDNVVTDNGSPKLFMQLENTAGERLAYKSLMLTGDGRLMSGSQIIYFDNIKAEQIQAPLTLKVYETVSTPLGEARRLLAALEQ